MSSNLQEPFSLKHTNGMSHPLPAIMGIAVPELQYANKRRNQY
jgi:hypothetical protein